MMAFRSSIHTSTQYTPYSLLFGREMRVPLDVMMGETQTTYQSSNYGEHATNLKSTLTNAYQAVRTHLSAAQRRQKEYFDKGVTYTKYEPGDQVFLFNPQLKVREASKFHRNWKGPYVVLEQPTDLTYRITKVGERPGRAKIVHFNNLKLYQRKGEQLQDAVKELQNDASEDDMEHENDCDALDQDLPGIEESNTFEIPTESDGIFQQSSHHCPTESPLHQQVEFVPDEQVGDVVQHQPIEHTVGDTSDETEYRSSSPRPQRSRKPPDMYGDWVVNSLEIRQVMDKQQEDQRLLRLKRLQPRLLAKARRLRKQLVVPRRDT